MTTLTVKKALRPPTLGSVYFQKLYEIFTSNEWRVEVLLAGHHINSTRFIHPDCPAAFFDVYYLKNEQPESWVCAVQDSVGNFYEIADIQEIIRGYWQIQNWFKNLLDAVGYSAGLSRAAGAGG